nr:hypothetical protein [Tanacetum cinerariifolium]
MDHYTKRAQWIYWARGDNEVELTDEESFDFDDEDEVAKIFRIDTNDRELKEKALKNKTIMEGMIDDDNESSNEGWRRWDGYEITNYDNEYENENDDEEKCESFDDHNLSVYTIRRFEMIKYSFGQDKEYVVVKEDEYEDLTSTSEDACRGYQEIFRKMDEGWMVTRAECRKLKKNSNLNTLL